MYAIRSYYETLLFIKVLFEVRQDILCDDAGPGQDGTIRGTHWVAIIGDASGSW